MKKIMKKIVMVLLLVGCLFLGLAVGGDGSSAVVMDAHVLENITAFADTSFFAADPCYFANGCIVARPDTARGQWQSSYEAWLKWADGLYLMDVPTTTKF